MALSQSALSQLLEAFRTGDGVDMIRESVRTVLQELVEFEAAGVIGAERYERTEDRVTERNGTRPKLLATKAGDIELRLGEHAPADLPQCLSRFLLEATGVRWLVAVSRETGEPTLREQRDAQQAAQIEEVARHPLVRAILDTFPGAVIERINQLEAQQAADAQDEPED